METRRERGRLTFFRNLIPDKIITEIEVEDGDDEKAQSELILDGNGDPIELTTTTTVNTVVGNDGFTTTTTTIETESYINGKVTNSSNTTSERVPTKPEDISTTDVSTAKSYASRRVYPSTITTTTFENDSFPDNFVGINGNFHSPVICPLQHRVSYI